MSRLSRIDFFEDFLKLLAQRSTCSRAKVAAIIVRDNRIISQGYNGSPAGQAHCLDVGCLIEPSTGGCIRTLHAETNAIAFAAKHGLKVDGAHLYCSLMPCLSCAKLIVNSGIAKVFYLEAYRDTKGVDLLISSGIPAVSTRGYHEGKN